MLGATVKPILRSPCRRNVTTESISADDITVRRRADSVDPRPEVVRDRLGPLVAADVGRSRGTGVR